nr:uncharacterized protein LOC102445487 [Pelodiscus sinensis]|eukprot:XP_025038787.1 uncharacterized protein LOC102445487 [Pelodiscus sinensis]
MAAMVQEEIPDFQERQDILDQEAHLVFLGKKEKKETLCIFQISLKVIPEQEVNQGSLAYLDLEAIGDQGAHMDSQANQACKVLQAFLGCQVKRAVQGLEWRDKRGSRVILDHPDLQDSHCWLGLLVLTWLKEKRV